MPELAELKLTRDYVNSITGGYNENRKSKLSFVNAAKNPQHKGEELNIPYDKFYIVAESRGKELVIILQDKYSDNYIPIRWTMGMSGYFKLTNTGQEPKHAHMKFYTDDGTTLSFVDVRRFGKWKQGLWWSENRGPDPTYQFEKFKANLQENLHKKIFDKPIHEMLMNQQYFNGIGNYLRAEIIYRVENLDPWISSREAIIKFPKMLELCRDIPLWAYERGGGSIRDWDNPFGDSNENFMKCYNVKGMKYIDDKNGRRFWFDPKWKKEGSKVHEII
jgi:endonuclease VIII-like 1